MNIAWWHRFSAPGQPRGHRDHDHARQAEPHAPRVPRVRQLTQPVPQGAGTGRELSGSSDRLDGQRSHLPDGDISNPCPTGAPLLIFGTTRRNPPDSPHFSHRMSLTRGHSPAAPAPPIRPQPPEGARRIWSRDVTRFGSPLVTHRYIYFAGTLAAGRPTLPLFIHCSRSACITR